MKKIVFALMGSLLPFLPLIPGDKQYELTTFHSKVQNEADKTRPHGSSRSSLVENIMACRNSCVTAYEKECCDQLRNRRTPNCTQFWTCACFCITLPILCCCMPQSFWDNDGTARSEQEDD